MVLELGHRVVSKELMVQEVGLDKRGDLVVGWCGSIS